MTEAFVAVGSNIEPEQHLRAAAQALKRQFPGTRFSACYRNPAVGFEGEDFLNAVAQLSTSLPIPALLAELRAIETACGRGPNDPKWGPRAIDLDLLLYDDVSGSGAGYTLPRPDLTRRPYMLGPLAELDPQRLYPPTGPSIAQLWARFPRSQVLLQRVSLDLNAVPAG
jgi:2-amino-4-hydroxy-6-hydroxymethyldihydropteridine diphosphokinase